MPNNPQMMAWATNEFNGPPHNGISIASWHVPSWFSCPNEMAVGRWLWKDGASSGCNDINNVGRKTETFTLADMERVVQEFDPSAVVKKVCTASPQTFINCFDFKVVAPAGPTPQPTPAPTPAPAPPTPQPTPAPTPP